MKLRRVPLAAETGGGGRGEVVELTGQPDEGLSPQEVEEVQTIGRPGSR